MQEYFFADYRLLMDDGIAEHESMRGLSAFRTEKLYTHTFTVHLGNGLALIGKYNEATAYPAVCTTENFTIHDTKDSWTFVNTVNDEVIKRNGRKVLACSRDYGEMTLYVSDVPYYEEKIDKWLRPAIPFSKIIRVACEAGMVIRDGLPLHAALVEKNGYGVLFLGPSGMGKSTQAKLWTKYQNADFIIGDRPVLRCIDGTWYGYGMPWDGKDRQKNQKCVPIRALVSLEQASENHIERLNRQQAMKVLLNQAMMPMWDDCATESAVSLMGRLASEVQFYHLKNLPDEEATAITRRAIEEQV